MTLFFEGGLSPMNCDSAVVFIAREPDGSALPLLLHKILFSPAATWLCRSLQLSGVRRFFVVTEPAFLTDSAACFPPDAIVLPFDHPQLNPLFIFLSKW